MVNTGVEIMNGRGELKKIGDENTTLEPVDP